jgi:hypothetical protein
MHVQGSDDDVFDDFEDVETGEVFKGGDAVTAIAQKAIHAAAAEELRLKKAAKKAAFDQQVRPAGQGCWLRRCGMGARAAAGAMNAGLPVGRCADAGAAVYVIERGTGLPRVGGDGAGLVRAVCCCEAAACTSLLAAACWRHRAPLR